MLLWAGFLLLLLASDSAQAQKVLVVNNGDWSNGATWSPAGSPTVGPVGANIPASRNGVVSTASQAGDTLILSSCDIAGGGNSNLNINSLSDLSVSSLLVGPLCSPGDVNRGFVFVNDGASLTVNGNVGFNNGVGTGGGQILVQSNAVFRVIGDIAPFDSDSEAILRLDTNSFFISGSTTVQQFTLGQTSGFSATYSTQGEITASQSFRVGFSGTGILTVNNHALTGVNDFVIGQNSGSSGRVIMVDATGSLTSASLIVADDGSGVLDLFDGIVTVQAARVGSGSGAGILTIGETTGSLSPSMTVTSSLFIIGSSTATGVLNMNRGSLNAVNALFGNSVGSSGAFNMAFGTASFSGDLTLGLQSSGVLTVTGGSLNINSRLRLATGTAGAGVFTMSGGTVTVGSSMSIGTFDSAAASANAVVTSGSLSVTIDIAIGSNGALSSGSFTVGDGSTAPAVTITRDLSVSNPGAGSMSFQSGTISVGRNFNVGSPATSVGDATIGGFSSPATLSVTGSWIQSDGTGSTTVGQNGVVTASQLIMSAAGTSTIDILTGASVTISGNVDYRNGVAGSDRIQVSGSGSLAVNGDMLISRTASTNNILKLSGGLCTVNIATLTAGVTSEFVFAPSDTDGQCPIRIGSSATITDATLTMDFSGSKKRAAITTATDDITLITSTSPITGTFASLPEGAVVFEFGDGTSYEITYAGGAGFDVVLLMAGISME